MRVLVVKIMMIINKLIYQINNNINLIIIVSQVTH